jgi:hypothetical protein
MEASEKELSGDEVVGRFEFPELAGSGTSGLRRRMAVVKIRAGLLHQISN